MISFRSLIVFLCLAVATIDPSVAAAQEKTGMKEGFELAQGSARIILVRPNIRVGSQSTGGLFEPNADWTQQARENIEAELRAVQARLGNEIVRQEDDISLTGQPLVTQYSQLFGTVADSAIQYQFFAGNRLPTKKAKGAGFDWGLGPEITTLKGDSDADYALFINTEDAYGSGGRKALQIVGLLSGMSISSGVHTGYAGLVDLNTGELVWLNADRRMGGDVRTPEGARKRVRQLLEDFPGSDGVDAS